MLRGLRLERGQAISGWGGCGRLYLKSERRHLEIEGSCHPRILGHRKGVSRSLSGTVSGGRLGRRLEILASRDGAGCLQMGAGGLKRVSSILGHALPSRDTPGVSGRHHLGTPHPAVLGRSTILRSENRLETAEKRP